MSENRNKLIWSLFDESGVWSQPYRDAGYRVLQVDHSLGIDIFDLQTRGDLPKPHGIMAAPPCCHFASSGARWWRQKDHDGRTGEAMGLVHRVLYIVQMVEPAWWVLENPVGRLPTLVPELGPVRYRFDPCDFGDPYTKKTCLFGDFDVEKLMAERTPVEPKIYKSAGKQGSYYWAKLSGQGKDTKRIRSRTPEGFARAWFRSHP